MGNALIDQVREELGCSAADRLVIALVRSLELEDQPGKEKLADLCRVAVMFAGNYMGRRLVGSPKKVGTSTCCNPVRLLCQRHPPTSGNLVFTTATRPAYTAEKVGEASWLFMMERQKRPLPRTRFCI